MKTVEVNIRKTPLHIDFLNELKNHNLLFENKKLIKKSTKNQLFIYNEDLIENIDNLIKKYNCFILIDESCENVNDMYKINNFSKINCVDISVKDEISNTIFSIMNNIKLYCCDVSSVENFVELEQMCIRYNKHFSTDKPIFVTLITTIIKDK